MKSVKRINHHALTSHRVKWGGCVSLRKRTKSNAATLALALCPQQRLINKPSQTLHSFSPMSAMLWEKVVFITGRGLSVASSRTPSSWRTYNFHRYNPRPTASRFAPSLHLEFRIVCVTQTVAMLCRPLERQSAPCFGPPS